MVYSTCSPSGAMRGFSTGVYIAGSSSSHSPASSRVCGSGAPVSSFQSMSVRNRRPLMVNTMRLPSSSAEYPTMPVPPSRARSRRAFSSAGTSSLSAVAPSSSRGSASLVSWCSPDSSNQLSHSAVTRSSGPSERRNRAREPSPTVCAERGAPQPKRSVRARRRGKCLIASLTSLVSLIPHNLRACAVSGAQACDAFPGMCRGCGCEVWA